jgi:glycosyltransferase involved in cell wall biosynthesis
MMRSLAIVAPRYGPEINGGAESLAREYALRLSAHADVTVLTTCALDYRTWSDHFPAGEERDGDVRVLRFSVPSPRDEAAFDALSSSVLAGSPSASDEVAWMDAQGPVSPGLEDHLRQHGDDYDAVIFIPYLYATTARALPIVAERSILVGAFHDEPPLRLSIFDDVVRQAGAVVVSTPEERELAVRRFGVLDSSMHLVGAGLDLATASNRRAERKSIGVTRDYVLALGRIDPSKGSADLIDLHRAYRQHRPNGVDLVMIGRAVMDLPEYPWLHAPGFVDEPTKAEAIANCTALVSASPYESLSLVLLEAWARGRPTVVTSRSDVMVGQTRRAGGGLWFSTPAEYAAALDLVSSRPALAWGLGRAGWRFAQTLDWDEVIARLLAAVDSVTHTGTASI